MISADGHYVGEVDGFLVDDDHITHFVLERGHLWGRREVTIPINLVAERRVRTRSRSRVSKDEVGRAPGAQGAPLVAAPALKSAGAPAAAVLALVAAPMRDPRRRGAIDEPVVADVPDEHQGADDERA